MDAFAVHGACGFWGTLAAALFDWGYAPHFNGWGGFSCTTGEDGACADDAFGKAFAANIVGLICIIAWVAGTSLCVFLPLKFAGFLRASDEIQDVGLDQAKHSPAKAYAMGPLAGPAI